MYRLEAILKFCSWWFYLTILHKMSYASLSDDFICAWKYAKYICWTYMFNMDNGHVSKHWNNCWQCWYGIMISLEAVIFPRKSYQHLESPLTTQHAGAGTSFLSSDCARKMVTWVSLLPALSWASGSQVTVLHCAKYCAN